MDLANDTDKLIDSYCLMDDAFMNAVFDGNNELVQFVLRIILHRPDLTVISVTTQKYMKSLHGRDTVLDILAKDGDGNEINIEIQNDSSGANPKRARFHAGILDSYMLLPGQSFDQLLDSYVIFITAKDVFGKGLPVYSINRRRDDNYEQFNDGGHIIYVNGSYRDDTSEVGKLMHDFFCAKADEANYKPVADAIRHFKETEGGRMRVGSEIERLKDVGRAEGRTEASIEIAKNLIETGEDSLEKIARVTGLTIEEVRELAGEQAV